MTSPFTHADIQRWRSMAGQGQRAQVYYEMGSRLIGTGHIEAARQMFFQASISSYSGSLGGAALLGNDWAKKNAPAQYPDDLNDFSLAVLNNVLEYMSADLDRGRDAVFTREEYFQIDYVAWRDLGVAHWFPGNYMRGQMAADGWRGIPSDSIIYAAGAFSPGTLNADAWGFRERALFSLQVGSVAGSLGDTIGLQADDWGMAGISPGHDIAANGYVGRVETLGGKQYIVVRRDDPANPGDPTFGTIVNFYAVRNPFDDPLADFVDGVYDTLEGDGGIWDAAGDLDRRALMERLGIDPDQWGLDQAAPHLPELMQRLGSGNAPSWFQETNANLIQNSSGSEFVGGYWQNLAYRSGNSTAKFRDVLIGFDGENPDEFVMGLRRERIRGNWPQRASDKRAKMKVSTVVFTNEQTGECSANISGKSTDSGRMIEISAGQLGSIFGSSLARLVQTDDPWAALGVGTVLGAIGLNIGQGIDNAIDGNGDTTFRTAFRNLPQELASAGISATGSYLFAEWVNDQGLGEVGSGLVNSGAGAAIGQIADNLLRLGQPITDAAGQFLNASGEVVQTSAQAATYEWSTGLTNPNIYLSAVGSFLGSYLASKLIKFDTIGGQIGASLGSSIGSIVAVNMAGGLASLQGITAILIPGIGAFIGFIVGGLIGSLVKGGAPKSGAVLGYDADAQRYEVTHAWKKNGGSKDAARSFAENVGALLNGVIEASGAKVIDASGVQTGYYEMKGDKLWYHAGGLGSAVDFVTKDVGRLINHGGYIALHDLSERLIGGDVYVKRAVSSTIAAAGGNRYATGGAYAAGDFEAQTLFGNIATAQDYAQYLDNAAVINALIAAEPQSAFTAGWTITFARVMELGLDKRWKSDWQGGWAANDNGALARAA